MLKQVLKILFIGTSAIGLVGLWRWYSVRDKRIPAPQADKLVLDLKQNLSLQRTGDTLIVSWTHDSRQADVYITTWSTPIDRDRPTVTVHNQQSTMLQGIDKTARYCVEVVFDDGAKLFQMERILPLASVPNFRDIGGYQTSDGHTVKWNRVYRSSGLDHLSDQDAQKLQNLDVRLVCDVRTVEEHLSDPDQLPNSIDVVNFPPASTDSVWVALFNLLFTHGYLEALLLDLYQRVMVQNNPQVFASIFERLADEHHLPIVIHCAAGKDRTGITIALLLAYLGVPDDTIIADYTLSNQYYDFFKHATRKNLAQLRIMGLTESDFDYLLVADGDVLQQTLDMVRKRFGSVEHYLIYYAGIAPDTLSAIRHNLLD